MVRLVGEGSGCGEAGWRGQWLWRGWLARVVVVARLVSKGSGCGKTGWMTACPAAGLLTLSRRGRGDPRPGGEGESAGPVHRDYPTIHSRAYHNLTLPYHPLTPGIQPETRSCLRGNLLLT